MSVKLLLAYTLLSSGVVMAAPFEGLYTTGSMKPDAIDRTSFVYVVDAHDGVWLASPMGAILSPRASLALVAPAAGKPWQLTRGNRTFVQHPDPFLARVAAHLKGKITLGGVGADGHATDAKLTLVDGIYFRNDMPSAERGPNCIAGYWVHDPTWNRERPFEAQPKQPARGKIGERLFDLFAVADCPAALDAHAANAPSEMMGAKIFARDDGQLLAVQIVSYMYVALYVRPGLPPAVMAELSRAASDEAAHQAE